LGHLRADGLRARRRRHAALFGLLVKRRRREAFLAFDLQSPPLAVKFRDVTLKSLRFVSEARGLDVLPADEEKTGGEGAAAGDGDDPPLKLLAIKRTPIATISDWSGKSVTMHCFDALRGCP
jgi:hypothetical protein